MLIFASRTVLNQFWKVLEKAIKKKWPLFHLRARLGVGCNLERVRCCWDQADWIRDGALLRPLCELLRFWWADVQNSPWIRPGQALYVSSLVYYTCHLPIWRGLPLSSVSSCSLSTRATFRFHWGNSWGGAPIEGPSKLGNLYIYLYRTVILGWLGTQRSFLKWP